MENNIVTYEEFLLRRIQWELKRSKDLETSSYHAERWANTLEYNTSNNDVEGLYDNINV